MRYDKKLPDDVEFNILQGICFQYNLYIFCIDYLEYL